MKHLLPIVVLVLVGTTTSLAQELAVEKITEAPASELSAPIQALLSGEAVKVRTGPDAALTFWWVKSVQATEGSEAAAWSQIAEGTIVGAVRVAGQQKDIRGRRVKQPGVYVLRYGIQPQNGDHLGVSPFRDFLLLVPALLDKNAEALGHDKLVELSPRAISISEAHPAALSLDPPVATEDVLKIHTNAAGHKAVIFEVPTTRDGQKLRFGLVVSGEIKP